MGKERDEVVCYMRSRQGVERLLVCALRAAKFGTEKFNGNGRLVGTLGRRVPRLVLLSVVLPKTSNCAVLRRLGDVPSMGSIPMVVIATGRTRFSGMGNLRNKTSSCVAGPFNVVRFITEMGTILEQDTHRGRSGRLRCSRLCLGMKHRRIRCQRRGISLAQGRFRLLRCLLRGGKLIVAEGRVLYRM